MDGGGPVLEWRFPETRRGSLSSGGRGGQTGVMEAGVDIVWHYRTNFLRRTLRYWFRRAGAGLPGLNLSLFLLSFFCCLSGYPGFFSRFLFRLSPRKEGNDWNETRRDLRVASVGVGLLGFKLVVSGLCEFQYGFGISAWCPSDIRYFLFLTFICFVLSRYFNVTRSNIFESRMTQYPPSES